MDLMNSRLGQISYRLLRVEYMEYILVAGDAYM